jgi:hypothetical protein
MVKKIIRDFVFCFGSVGKWWKKLASRSGIYTLFYPTHSLSLSMHFAVFKFE